MAETQSPSAADVSGDVPPPGSSSGGGGVGGVDGGSGRRTKVVVVGAGVAGLTAAVKLVNNGVEDVVVLEAQDYVGGRVKAVTRGETRYDLGAMFIHGQTGNPIFEMVQRLRCLGNSRHDWPPYFYTNNRTRVPVSDFEDLFDYIDQRLEVGHDPQLGQNRLEFMSSFYQQFLLDNQITTDSAEREIHDAAFGWYCFYDELNEGVDSLSDVSEWVLGQHYVTLDGSQETLIRGGYTTVIRALEKVLPKEVVHLGLPVRKIDWSQPGDGGILVHCTNGTVIATDYVIVTVSMGCLKADHTTMFTPPLPTPLVNTMNRLKMGTIGKIFLKWDTPFWQEDNTHFDFLWLKSSPGSLVSDKSKRQTRLGKLWWQYIPGLQIVPEQPKILVVWLSEHQLDAIRDIADQEIMDVLYELMNVFLFDVDVSMPNEIVRTNWKENPYTRGAYTYPVPSFDASDILNISQPAFPSPNDPRLTFAGEAFTVEYMTNVHGAFITGERQADRVLTACGISDARPVVDVVCDA